MQEITRRVNATVGFWLVVLIYVILGLLEVDHLGWKLGRMSNRHAARVLLEGGVADAARFRTYLWIRTLMSLATGALVFLFAALVGLNLALEWGVLAFALNYIPYLGTFVARLFPTLFALAQFDSLQSAVAVFAGLGLIQFAVGSYVEPRVSGKALAMSPFVVSFAVFLWAFIWGGGGAFIGVPIVIALLTFCAQHPSSQWLAELLGEPGEQPSAPPRGSPPA